MFIPLLFWVLATGAKSYPNRQQRRCEEYYGSSEKGKSHEKVSLLIFVPWMGTSVCAHVYKVREVEVLGKPGTCTDGPGDPLSLALGVMPFLSCRPLTQWLLFLSNVKR